MSRSNNDAIFNVFGNSWGNTFQKFLIFSPVVVVFDVIINTNPSLIRIPQVSHGYTCINILWMCQNITHPYMHHQLIFPSFAKVYTLFCFVIQHFEQSCNVPIGVFRMTSLGEI
eukprot:12492027-Ditylum_brightwellii.AAC.1